MKTKTLKVISFKGGTTIPAGVEVDISWRNEQAHIVYLVFNKTEYKCPSAVLPFLDVEYPSMGEIESWVIDSICRSVGGDQVEPDGWDSEGTPSWLLVLGLI